MRTKTKTKTATHTAAVELQSVIHNTMSVTGVSSEDRSRLIFELGCRFIEDRVPDEELRYDLLVEKDLGFWNWWVVAFANDDKMLLACYKNAGLPKHFCYATDKQYMLCSSSIDTEFKEFINALIKWLEHEKV